MKSTTCEPNVVCINIQILSFYYVIYPQRSVFLVAKTYRLGRQIAGDSRGAIYLHFMNDNSPRLFHCWDILRCFALLYVPSDLWFLCLTQIAEDGRGAIYQQWLLYEIPDGI